MSRSARWRAGLSLGLGGIAMLLAMRGASSALFWRTRVVARVPTREKIVALTFDDGPHPTFTPELLRLLDRYEVRATFFMIGRRMQQYPEVVKAVLAHGHAIGNHTYSHPRDLTAETPAQVRGELEQCEQVIERVGGRRAYLFRPPRGLMDGAVFRAAAAEGYQTILWTVSADHHDAPTPELMARRVLDHIRPGGIILAHDGVFCTRWKDVAATPLIIEGLQRRGYRFVTVPELLAAAAGGY
jgi:peptidoglycan/xylan/chitin deacetylase (PgdA/CDA1 family)